MSSEKPTFRRLAKRFDLIVDTVSGLSFLTHFNSISKGVIDLRDVVYFMAVIGAWLYATAIVLDMKKAD